MPSFDIVSQADSHEVQNAVDQTERELIQRFDFRDTGTEIKSTDSGFELRANSEDRLKAAYEVLRDKFVKRKVSLKFLDANDPESAGGQTWKMSVALRQGIDKDNARKIVQTIKNEKKLKVTPAIQGEAVRVTGKKRDELQAIINMLKEKEFPIELSFENYRD